MEEIFRQILSQLHSSWRFRWIGLLAAWIVACLGWLTVYALPASYAAETRVFVNTETALRPLLRGLAFQSDVMSNVNMMTRVMLSRPNLEKVARKTDLHLRADTSEDMERLVEKMRSEIRIAGGRSNNIFTISYRDYDRQKAEAVVRELLETFVEDSLSATRTDSTSAQAFLQNQIDEYEARLEEAESNLAEFKKRNLGAMLGGGGDLYSRLEEAIADAERTRSELEIAIDRQEELRRQLEGEEPVFGIMNSSNDDFLQSETGSKIAQLERQLDNLLLRYTEKHPDVIATREMIESLRDQMQSEVEAAKATGLVTAGLAQNPVYQSLRLALSEAEVEVSTLRSKLGQKTKIVNDLRAGADSIPELQAERTSLTRNYDVTKRQHTQLVQRLEAARLSEQAEQSSDEVQFRIIDPPAAQLKPVAPNRPLLLSLVFLIALGAGGATAFLLNQLNPVFIDASEVRSILGKPVLGVVSAVRTSSEILHRRMQLTSWIGGVLGLTILFISALLLHEHGVRLARLIIDRGLL